MALSNVAFSSAEIEVLKKLMQESPFTFIHKFAATQKYLSDAGICNKIAAYQKNPNGINFETYLEDPQFKAMCRALLTAMQGPGASLVLPPPPPPVIFSNPITRLVDATKKGNLEDIKKLLSQYDEVILYEGDELGLTILHHAAQSNRLEIVKYLLTNKNIDINVKSLPGYTPLHLAALEGNLEIAKILLQYGADANAKDNGGSTPLDYAFQTNYEPLVDLFLESISNSHSAPSNKNNNNNNNPNSFFEKPNFFNPPPSSNNSNNRNNNNNNNTEESDLSLTFMASLFDDPLTVKQPTPTQSQQASPLVLQKQPVVAPVVSSQKPPIIPQFVSPASTTTRPSVQQQSPLFNPFLGDLFASPPNQKTPSLFDEPLTLPKQTTTVAPSSQPSTVVQAATNNKSANTNNNAGGVQISATMTTTFTATQLSKSEEVVALLQRINDLEEQISKYEESNLCTICMEKPINTVILECAHLAVCLTCSTTHKQRLQACPVCSAKITRIIRTYKTT